MTSVALRGDDSASFSNVFQVEFWWTQSWVSRSSCKVVAVTQKKVPDKLMDKEWYDSKSEPADQSV